MQALSLVIGALLPLGCEAEDTMAESGVKSRAFACAKARGMVGKGSRDPKRTSMAYEGQLAEMVKFQGFKDDRGDAYYARPTRAARFGGIVVIHHLPGWD